MMRFLRYHIIPRILSGLLRLIYFTCKISIEGMEDFSLGVREKGGILALWHQHLVVMPYLVKKCPADLNFIAAMSKSRDADPLAGTAALISNVDTLRVPHNARSQALRGMLKALKDQKVLLITPDGPKGPAHALKPGVVFIARRTKVPVYPVAWIADNFWQLGTWDGMMLPKPFSQITIKVGVRVEMSPKKGEQGQDESMRSLENALQSCV